MVVAEALTLKIAAHNNFYSHDNNISLSSFLKYAYYLRNSSFFPPQQMIN